MKKQPIHLMVVLFLPLVFASCSDDGDCTCPSEEAHALEDYWFGFAGTGPTNLVIDNSGDILLISGGFPIDIHATLSEEIPGVYHGDFVPSDGTTNVTGKLLVDDSVSHAGFLYDGYFYIALERSANIERSFTFEDSDLIATWTGYGYAYNATSDAFEKIEPVEVTASLTITGTSYLGTLPDGTINGEIDVFDSSHGFWHGTGVSGAEVEIFMTPDKEFVAVRSIPLGATDYTDLLYFALNRQ